MAVNLPVLVLAGGLSYEREVSLRSGRRICDALHSADVEARMVDLDQQLLPVLSNEREVVVFNALHGSGGEDGSVAEVLELVRCPYVGSEPEAARRAYDKPNAKAVARELGAITPKYVALPEPMFRDLGAQKVLDAVVARLGIPLVVKPARGGSALGLSIVKHASELPAAMVKCYGYGDVALLEQFVEGAELAVTIVDSGQGPRVLPPIELRPRVTPYDYAARYTAGSVDFLFPANISTEVSEQARATALMLHQRLGLRDLTRTDFILDSAGQLNFLEITTSPGLTETSVVPVALAADGLHLSEVALSLATNALERAAARTE